jgi:hypothetical protein
MKGALMKYIHNLKILLIKYKDGENFEIARGPWLPGLPHLLPLLKSLIEKWMFIFTFVSLNHPQETTPVDYFTLIMFQIFSKV